jgi:hypothetical protein
VKNKFKFLSLSAKGGRAQFTLMQPFAGAPPLDAMRDQILARIRLAAAAVGEEVAGLGVGRVSQYGAQPAPIQFETVDQLLPKETDFYYKDYRAISQSIAPCYALDFSTPGVLEKSVGMLKGQTVYKDHYYWSVDNWVGAISDSRWDAEGNDAGGIPGINVTLKLDSKKDPMLVRGVAMTPPAVHSTSSTVFFEFEFSHPKLVEEGRFWQLLMEEVDGELVRLIVTAILGYWEQSLVFQGAQDENKQLPAPEGADDLIEDNVEDEQEERGMRARPIGAEKNFKAGTTRPTQKEGRTTVKVTDAQKQLLGITHEGNDVPDEMVLQVAGSLASRAQVADELLSGARAECLRIAKLAVLGSAEGQLPEALAGVINGADHKTLAGLTAMYTQDAAKKFPQTCQSCGQQTSTRSSIEDKTQVEAASQAQAPLVSDVLFS